MGATGLADLVDMGLARCVGVSNHNVKQMRTAHAILAARGIPLAFNQLQYRCVPPPTLRNVSDTNS